MTTAAPGMNTFRGAVTVVTAVGALALAGAGARSPAAGGAERAIHTGVPARIGPAARYLFHLHGRAVEVDGVTARTRWGPYRYQEVLGHGVFLTPNKIWVDPLVDWALLK